MFCCLVHRVCTVLAPELVLIEEGWVDPPTMNLFELDLVVHFSLRQIGSAARNTAWFFHGFRWSEEQFHDDDCRTLTLCPCMSPFGRTSLSVFFCLRLLFASVQQLRCQTFSVLFHTSARHRLDFCVLVIPESLLFAVSAFSFSRASLMLSISFGFDWAG